jgi:hypothetical protein
VRGRRVQDAADEDDGRRDENAALAAEAVDDVAGEEARDDAAEVLRGREEALEVGVDAELGLEGGLGVC